MTPFDFFQIQQKIMSRDVSAEDEIADSVFVQVYQFLANIFGVPFLIL